MLGEKLLGKKRRPEVGKILETQDGKFRVMIFTEKEFGIGAGSFGKCYLGRILFENDGNAQHMNINEFLEENKLVVVKEIQKMSNTPDAERVRNNYRREVDLLSKVTIGAKIQCNNLVKVYPYELQSENHYYIVMEYCQNRSLDSYVALRRETNKLSYFQFCQIMLDLLNGLEVIHANKIVHEDLKPENVFIKDCFKIGDFGLSKKINEEFRTRGGTQYYNAPEKYEGEKPDYPSDIYALGVILFEILYGEHPYISQNQFKLYEACEAKDEQLKNPKKYSRANPNLERDRRRLRTKIFLKYMKSRQIKNIQPIIYCPERFKQKFQQIQVIVKQMCRLNPDYRLTYYMIVQELYLLKVDKDFAREDLFADFKQLTRSDLDFTLSNIVQQQGSQMVQHTINRTINKRYIKSSDNELLQKLKQHMLDANMKVRILCDLYLQIRSDDYNQYTSWQQTIFEHLCDNYLYNLNSKEIKHVYKALAVMNQKDRDSFYQQNLDLILRIFKMNESYLLSQCFQNQLEPEMLEKARNDILNYLRKQFTEEMCLTNEQLATASLKLIFYRMLLFEEQVDKGTTDKNAFQFYEQCQAQQYKVLKRQYTPQSVATFFEQNGFAFMRQLDD